MTRAFLFAAALLLICTAVNAQITDEPGVIVLGIAQDGGFPHAGCVKECCTTAWSDPSIQRLVVSLAITDPESGKWYLVEATPDIKRQLHLFSELTGGRYNYLPEAIIITHAHIGHYAGLTNLGREVMNTKSIPVYTLPRMKDFLETNGPWSQLVKLNNISLTEVLPGGEVTLTEKITVSFFTVPHRDEYSETAGLNIHTPSKNYLFIPDIDKWERWDESIIAKVKAVDYAFIDGTFMSISELPGRNIEEIPHPFIVESIELFREQPAEVRSKIHFIHLNHTNPLLWNRSLTAVDDAGMKVAVQGSYY